MLVEHGCPSPRPRSGGPLGGTPPLVDLVPARDWGASTTIPFFGALTGTDRTALLQEPLPELTADD